MSRRTFAGLIAAGLAATACKKAEPGAAAAARDATAVSTDAASAVALPVGTWADRGIMVVVEVRGRWFVSLEGWYHPADGSRPSHDWTNTAPIEEFDHHIMVQAATQAPRAWRAIVGQPVAARGADGAPCAATIAGLAWLGAGDWGAWEPPSLVAELHPDASCAPAMITRRPTVRAGARAAVDDATTRRVLAAFRALPSYRALARAYPGDMGYEAMVWGFAFDDGLRVVVAKWFERHDSACNADPAMLRAEYAVTSAVPRLEWESRRLQAMKPRALFDSNGDGVMELITGVATVDDGMTLYTYLAGYLDPALPEDDQTPDGSMVSSRYGGCD